MRLAIVDNNKCKPKRCQQECRKSCPVVRMGKMCIEVKSTSQLAIISEQLCTGCNQCVKACPFNAIKIINLPKQLDSDTTHRYNKNSFVLYRLPTPKPGQILGLVGSNGTGKSTALQILANMLKPNLGNYRQPPAWQEILNNYKGSELQNYFTKILEDNLTARIKPQYVDLVANAYPNITVEKAVSDDLMEQLDLLKIRDRKIKYLSGGELQRFAIAATISKSANVYMFDEPTSYLDIKQRLKAARVITETKKSDNYVICVEHDLSILDYLSDFICLLYGQPSAYGIVTMPYSTREGINIFLEGYIPTENMRFRDYELNFKNSVELNESEKPSTVCYEYPDMQKQLGNFNLTVQAGNFNTSEIIVLLGENGTGKTTFIKMLKDHYKDNLAVSYKPQQLSPKVKSTVRDLLLSKIQKAYINQNFKTEVLKPMLIDDIIDQNVSDLSGGELQRLAIVLTLGKPANIYLIDEPSAYLDSEQRLITAKVIKRFILNNQCTAFIVEHDFMMSLYLADRVIVYDGEPGINTVANSPCSLEIGMNKFLKQLDVTFRRDQISYRPRINKKDSAKEVEQKANGQYFYQV